MNETQLIRLHLEQRQSAWLDNLRRDDLTSGRLASMIAAGIRGLTSNPTIFQKAIKDSSAYDQQIHELAQLSDVEELYWSLVCTDISKALDEFQPLYDETNGEDGLVSVEIDPNLARDSEATLSSARALWERIDRPNVMIKIPATTESLPAIRAMTALGANVNVTLIFGLSRYREVMLAYLDGLSDRLAAGLPIDTIASVASFFISRVDTEVDRRLEAIGTPRALALRGRAAVAQAKLAYRMFLEVFDGAEWEMLRLQGARVQRPLWASTSTKNPAYPDTLYVDELIGPNTVNTLPEATIEAFCDHGTIGRTIDRDLDDSSRIWTELSEVGVDLADVSDVLEQEGLLSFQNSFDDLMKALVAKRA